MNQRDWSSNMSGSFSHLYTLKQCIWSLLTTEAAPVWWYVRLNVTQSGAEGKHMCPANLKVRKHDVMSHCGGDFFIVNDRRVRKADPFFGLRSSVLDSLSYPSTPPDSHPITKAFYIPLNFIWHLHMVSQSSADCPFLRTRSLKSAEAHRPLHKAVCAFTREYWRQRTFKEAFSTFVQTEWNLVQK